MWYFFIIFITNTSSNGILIEDTNFMMTQRCNKTTKVFSNLRFETYTNTVVHTFQIGYTEKLSSGGDCCVNKTTLMNLRSPCNILLN